LRWRSARRAWENERLKEEFAVEAGAGVGEFAGC
jgi:hypothetical protein